MEKALLIENKESLAATLLREVQRVYKASQLVNNEEEALQCLASDVFEVLIYHVEETFDFDFIDRVHEAHPNLIIVPIVQGVFHDYLDAFKDRCHLQHFISTTEHFPLLDILNTVEKICHHEKVFGLKHYFPPGSPMKEIVVSDSRDKESYIKECLQFLINGCRISRLVQSRIGNIMDELIMNMLWDAPRDEAGNALYNNRSRKEAVALDAVQAGRLQVTYQTGTIGLCARDPFGAITLEKVLRFLHKCYHRSQQIGSEGAGAGLGLYMVYRFSNNFTINVQPGKCTEFVVLFDSRFNLDVTETVKSFHYFEVA